MGVIESFLLSQNGITLLACGGGFLVLSLLPKSARNQLSGGRWAEKRHRMAARAEAIRQLTQRRRNAVALYLGNPARPNDPRPIYLPNVERGVAVLGAPGSGKTFSVIDPAIRSALLEGLPLILYDFKYPTQSARAAAYARSLGYDVRIFAPGFAESDVCNPLDFLSDATDAETARQMATVLNRNFRLVTDGKDDPFFTNAGDQLVEAILMAAKASPFPDIMMCQALLSLDDLAGRVERADLNYWVRSSFSQLLSVKQSEKTVASIAATATAVFTRFMKPSVLAAFTGETTLPLDLSGRQMLIFGMDRQRRDVVGPLLATVLHLVVTRNVVRRRTDPLIVSLDELPTIFLPSLVQWLNENREDGLACILGFQNLAQLEKAYGKDTARAISGACATKAIFNPGEYESAKVFSDFLGDEEIKEKQKSKGTSGGKASSNVTQQSKTRKLYEPSAFLKLQRGRCVLISPGRQDQSEASIPAIEKIRIPKADIAAFEASERLWDNLREELIARSSQRKPSQQDLQQRYEAAELLFKKVPDEESLKNRLQQIL
jgi:type IV secretory pathway TraG/TraD family ATPase VirD4